MRLHTEDAADDLRPLVRDLQSKGWIIAKGFLFALLTLSSAGLLLLDAPTPRTVVLVVILIWSASRFYYFLFYVLEKYVDPTLRYAGLGSLMGAAWKRRSRP